MDISKGIVEIDNELVVKPNFTFEQFKETKYYTNQDGIRIIYLDEPQIIKNRKYIVSLFFRDGKIYMLSLICCDAEYSEKDESKRKDLHDLILKELGVLENSNFEWGEIKSIYDARSNISSMGHSYIKMHPEIIKEAKERMDTAGNATKRMLQCFLEVFNIL